jgi:dolichol-phosphate mannosyltransferase
MKHDQPAPELSVVIPLHNEEGNFPELHRRLLEIIPRLTENFEIIYINDGSADRTLSLLRDAAAWEARIKYVSFSRNFGHQGALLAGIVHSTGKAIVTMDGDLQDPPELLPEMFQKFCEGFNVVYARRASREGESFF